MKLAAIIQARLGSKRLPGKVMMDIGGKPLLWHVIQNAKKAVEQVIVATPDAAIIEYAHDQYVDTFLGSENDVLDRYYQAAMCFDITHIVRITSDNPFVDPALVRQLIDFYFEGCYDWAANCRLKVTYPVGNDAEIFTRQALEVAWAKATEPYDRDSVTSYIYHHPETFRLGVMENTRDESHLRWTVDTLEDLERVRKIYEERQYVCSPT